MPPGRWRSLQLRQMWRWIGCVGENERRPLTYFSIDPQCVFLTTMWESGDRKEPTIMRASNRRSQFLAMTIQLADTLSNPRRKTPALLAQLTSTTRNNLRRARIAQEGHFVFRIPKKTRG